MEKSIWQYGAYKNWEVAVFIAVFFLVGLLIGNAIPNDNIYTENMKICVEQGGEYYLSLGNDKWDYERCKIEKEISF